MYIKVIKLLLYTMNKMSVSIKWLIQNLYYVYCEYLIFDKKWNPVAVKKIDP